MNYRTFCFAGGGGGHVPSPSTSSSTPAQNFQIKVTKRLPTLMARHKRKYTFPRIVTNLMVPAKTFPFFNSSQFNNAKFSCCYLTYLTSFFSCDDSGTDFVLSNQSWSNLCQPIAFLTSHENDTSLTVHKIIWNHRNELIITS